MVFATDLSVKEQQMTVEAADDDRRETLRVLCIIAGFGVVSALLGTSLLHSAHREHVDFLVPWWAFVAFFAMTESAVFHVQVKREAQTVSISELPLVIGLFFADPAELLVGRVLGSFLVFALIRRSSPLKSAFNTALVVTETLVALTVFRAIAGATIAGGDPTAWLAALAAALAANAVGSVALSLVIAVYEGGLVWSEMAKEMVTGQAFAPGVVVMALVTVDSLANDARSAWLVGGSAVTLILCYRMYASLYDRHVNLERLYHFSQAVTDSSANESVVKRVLEEAMELLQSGQAFLHLAPSHSSTAPIRIMLGEGGEPERSVVPADSADWLQDRVVGEGTAVVLGRRSREEHVRRWLADAALRDAVAVPLRGADRIIGMLVVGERLGEVRTYDREDVILLETLANHASVALQKGELIEQLQHEALHDTLTGLPNRAQLQRELGQALQRSITSSSPLAIMILDLDGFKDVNDTLGHQQGDRVLVEVAQRLSAAVGDEGMVARLGGDEFAVLVPRLQGRQHAEAVCGRLVGALQVPMELQGMQFEVGASVGAALCPEHGMDASLLMKRADMAMYEAKSAAIKARIFEPNNDASGARRLALVAEMRNALTTGEIEVYLQPQLDLASGQVQSLEALARWHHPTLGWVSPDEFIPVAERSGLIKPLTAAVLDQALSGLSAWREDDVSVAVNLSPRSLLDPELVGSVHAVLQKWGIAPHRLILEVTEGAVMTDADRAIALLGRLRDLGVRLSIDDFGTGYSSLSYLTQLPVHEVKIDKSFITDVTDSPGDLAIVRSIIGLGTTLGLEIVAEGVEDAPTQDLLRALGCTRIQGWHVARPMPVFEVGDWLSNHELNVAPEPAAIVEVA
jgi:diguanylate cyclase (GGDEF)-like protein